MNRDNENNRMLMAVYGHYGSLNHGNEAILRGLRKLFASEDIVLYSYNPNSDHQYGLETEFIIKPFMRDFRKYSLIHIIIHLITIISKSLTWYYSYRLKPFFQSRHSLYMFEAGDQFCENNALKRFYNFINVKIKKNSGTTVVLPCTIDKETLDDIGFVNELRKYDLIIARETITYNVLVDKGLGYLTKYSPCPAFLMDPRKCELPVLFTDHSVVGITIGTLAQGKSEYSEVLYRNTKSLIRYIIENTNYSIALIPHVNVDENLSDVTVLRKIFDEIRNDKRVFLVPEQRADEQKYIIGKCRFYFTVRTHVSIAAYSSSVPVVVIGYSQKSKGIAYDLFGTYDNYVVPIESLVQEDKLIESFIWLQNNEDEIKQEYKESLHEYLKKINPDLFMPTCYKDFK